MFLINAQTSFTPDELDMLAAAHSLLHRLGRETSRLTPAGPDWDDFVRLAHHNLGMVMNRFATTNWLGVQEWYWVRESETELPSLPPSQFGAVQHNTL